MWLKSHAQYWEYHVSGPFQWLSSSKSLIPFFIKHIAQVHASVQCLEKGRHNTVASSHFICFCPRNDHSGIEYLDHFISKCFLGQKWSFSSRDLRDRSSTMSIPYVSSSGMISKICQGLVIENLTSSKMEPGRILDHCFPAPGCSLIYRVLRVHVFHDALSFTLPYSRSSGCRSSSEDNRLPN